MTLLHFVVDVVERENSEWLTFPNDFKNLPAAARLSLDQLTGDMGELSKSVAKLTKQIEKVGKDTPEISEQFQDFLTLSASQIGDAQGKVTEAKDLETKLAQQFCEERKKFTLDEFFKSMNLFCEKLKAARVENEERRKREARQAAIKAKQDEAAAGKGNGANGAGGKVKLKSRPLPTNDDKSIVDMLLDDIRKGSFDLKRTQR
jgi:septal ring factor EnvC (AmiA/AmiB activator)